MKLNLLRTRGPRETRDDHCAIRNSVTLADRLGFEAAYLAGASPHNFVEKNSSIHFEHLKVGFDAAAFGPSCPSKLETQVQSISNALDGHLYVGVKICNEKSSPQCKTEAQTFETLFSSATNQSSNFIASRAPMQPTCPDIVGLPLTGAPHESATSAARGYCPLTPSWLSPNDVARHWPAIVSGATSSLRRACPSHWQVARTIVIHDDPSVIEAYVFGRHSPIRAHYCALRTAGVISQDIDAALRACVIAGTATQVAEKIYNLRERAGNFGTLTYVDHAGADTVLTRNTLTQLAEDVLPLIESDSKITTKELEKT